MPNPINPYPQAKSETSAESILEWVESRIADHLKDVEAMRAEKGITAVPEHLFGQVAECQYVVDEIRRRITAEAERRAKAFTATGTEL